MVLPDHVLLAPQVKPQADFADFATIMQLSFMFRMTDSEVYMVLSALIILTLFHVALRLMKLPSEFAPTLTTETYGPPDLGECASEKRH
jgi:hypothetical protein